LALLALISSHLLLLLLLFPTGACDVGAMKPSPVPFISISQRTGVHPSRILFIGDSFEKDVIGATACGMTGGLILRKDFKTQIVPDPEVEEDRIAHGDLTKEFLTEENEKLLSHRKYIILNTLYPKEINEKVNNYFSRR
jgi:FMN phosphatase YigB (HAD superfamily)